MIDKAIIKIIMHKLKNPRMRPLTLSNILIFVYHTRPNDIYFLYIHIYTE